VGVVQHRHRPNIFLAKPAASLHKPDGLDIITHANLLLSVMGAFAEFERALIRERQREGIALAKRRGRIGGGARRSAPCNGWRHGHA